MHIKHNIKGHLLALWPLIFVLLVSTIFPLLYSCYYNSNLYMYMTIPLCLFCIPAIVVYGSFSLQDFGKSIKSTQNYILIIRDSKVLKKINKKDIDTERSFVKKVLYEDYWFLPWYGLYQTELALSNNEKYHVSSLLLKINDLNRMKVFIPQKHSGMPF